MKSFLQTRSRLRSGPRRPQRADLSLEVLEQRELLSAAPAHKAIGPLTQSGAKTALVASSTTAHTTIAPPSQSGVKTALVASSTTAHTVTAGATATTLSQTAVLAKRLDGLGLNDLRFLAELVATAELIKASNFTPKSDSNPVSGSMATSSDSTDTTLSDLLQQMQNVFGSDLTEDNAAGTASASASFPGQAALASLSDALTSALADLGITADQFGNNSASIDTSLLTQLAPNQGQDDPGGNSSITPSWWPSGPNLADFQSAAQFQAGLAGDLNSWASCVSNFSGAGGGMGAAGGAVVGGIGGAGGGAVAIPLVGSVPGWVAGAAAGAGFGGALGVAAGGAVGVVVCTYQEAKSTGQTPTPTTPTPTPTPTPKDGESQSGGTKSPPAPPADPADAGSQSGGTKTTPNPEATGPTSARGSGATGADLWQHLAIVQSEVSSPTDEGHHQVTEADVQKLLTTMIVSIVSKVDPNPEATSPPAGGTAGSDVSQDAGHLPVVGVIDGGLGGDGLPVNSNGGGTLRGPIPAVGRGVPSGPKG